MSLNVGKTEQYNINSFLGITSGANVGIQGKTTSPVDYKTKSYAAISYEKSPVVKDTVPTKYADGTPFWADYVTPNNVWTC